MKIEKTTKYKRELKKVLKSPTISIKKIDKTIETFITNPEQNSLDTKIIKGCSDYTNLHQIRINSDYRILFELIDEIMLLRHIGKHNYIEKRTKDC
ncbi:hypothetical protein MNB_SV-12-418 [hydrothermal vent metagenome]|uniref:RelE/StbE replicon stabilization toxin n=1 Tax=hydrothermal vent metagenome TaxID=652676 RepID=A0A1W1BE02_9ZZZZ